MRPMTYKSQINELKNWSLRKTFIVRRSIAPNNVLDRTHKFKIEDLFDFPKSPQKPVKTVKKPKSIPETSESKPEPQPNKKMKRRCSEIFTINPNLNSNFTMNTFSMSKLRLRKYTYKPKQQNVKLKVVIGANKIY